MPRGSYVSVIKEKIYIVSFYTLLINSSAWGATSLLAVKIRRGLLALPLLFFFSSDAIMRSVITVIYRQ